MTASDAMAAAPATVGDRVLDPSPNGNGVTTGRRRRFIDDRADKKRAKTAPVDEPVQVPAAKPTRSERKQLNRLQARKVRRVIRHFEPWSVLKVSLLFYFCLFVVFMVAGVVLWNLATATGMMGDIEGFVEDAFAFQTFRFDGFTVFRATFLIGLILVIAGTGINVLLAVLFNLISDLVGGVRVTVIEEESVRPMPATTEAMPATTEAMPATTEAKTPTT